VTPLSAPFGCFYPRLRSLCGDGFDGNGGALPPEGRTSCTPSDLRCRGHDDRSRSLIARFRVASFQAHRLPPAPHGPDHKRPSNAAWRRPPPSNASQARPDALWGNNEEPVRRPCLAIPGRRRETIFRGPETWGTASSPHAPRRPRLASTPAGVSV